MRETKKLSYCPDCGAPTGPDGMVPVCKAFSGELCIECCGCPDHNPDRRVSPSGATHE